MAPVCTGDRLMSKLSARTVAACRHTKRSHPTRRLQVKFEKTQHDYKHRCATPAGAAAPAPAAHRIQPNATPRCSSAYRSDRMAVTHGMTSASPAPDSAANASAWEMPQRTVPPPHACDACVWERG